MSNEKRINRKTLTRNMVYTALMAVLGLILKQLDFPLPLMPPWLKIDISTMPSLFTGFMLGPLWGMAVLGIMNLVDLLNTSSAGVGQLADFVVGCSLCLPAAFIYSKEKSLAGALVGVAVGIPLMVGTGLLANRFLLIPFYVRAYFKDDAVAMFSSASGSNSSISSMDTYLMYAVLPFNMLKGLLISVITVPLYRRLEPMLKRKSAA